MNSSFLKLFLLPFILITFISCSDGDAANNNDDSTSPDTGESNETQSNEEENDGPFGIKSGMIQFEDKNLTGEKTADYNLYFDNYGSLLKLEETIDGETSVYMFNDATKKGVTKFAGRKASKIFMRQGEINRFVVMRSTSGYVQQDNEAILGMDCEVFTNNATSAEGESQSVYWIHKGIVLKEINRLGMGYIYEAVNFEEKEIDKAIFSLADGTEMPHDIFE